MNLTNASPLVPDTPLRGNPPKDDVVIKEVLLGIFLTLALVVIILTQRCMLQKRVNKNNQKRIAVRS